MYKGVEKQTRVSERIHTGVGMVTLERWEIEGKLGNEVELFVFY